MNRDHPTEMIPMPSVSEFEVVLRGYDRSQVREAVERLEADIRIALTDRDAAVARSSDLASQLSAVHAEMESLRRKLSTAATPTYETMGERIANMLRLAEEEAAELRRNAHTDTAALRAEVQALAEQSETVAAAQTAERERLTAQAERAATALTDKATSTSTAVVNQAQSKAQALVADAERAAAEMVRTAEATRDQLVTQAQQQAKKADEDYEISLRARRTEAGRAEAERLRASTDDAHRRVAEARDHAAKLVADAEAQRSRTIQEGDLRRQEIEAVRAQALGQLRDVRALLTGLPPETDPEPAQAAAVTPPGTPHVGREVGPTPTPDAPAAGMAPTDLPPTDTAPAGSPQAQDPPTPPPPSDPTRPISHPTVGRDSDAPSTGNSPKSRTRKN